MILTDQDVGADSGHGWSVAAGRDAIEGSIGYAGALSSLFFRQKGMAHSLSEMVGRLVGMGDLGLVVGARRTKKGPAN